MKPQIKKEVARKYFIKSKPSEKLEKLISEIKGFMHFTEFASEENGYQYTIVFKHSTKQQTVKRRLKTCYKKVFGGTKSKT